MEPQEVKEPEVKEAEVVAQPSEPIVAQAAEESDKEINWKKFRAQREKERQEAEKLRKEKEEADRRAREKEQEAEALKAALDAMLQPGFQQPEENEDDKISKAIERAFAERDAKRAKEKQEREAKELPARLQKEHPDFDKVVNQESLDYLEYHHPEIATPYAHMPNSLEKWSLIYRAIKKVMPTSSQQIKARLEENAAKPASLSSGIVKSQDSAPMILDDARKKQNWERMQKIMNGL